MTAPFVTPYPDRAMSVVAPAATRLAEAPLGRIRAVVVLHREIQACVHRLLAERGPPSGFVVSEQAAHRLEPGTEQTAHVLALMLLHHLEEHLLHENRVGRTGPGASERVLLDLGLQILPGNDAVHEVALLHLLRRERAAGEDHLLKLPEPHHRRPL